MKIEFDGPTRASGQQAVTVFDDGDSIGIRTRDFATTVESGGVLIHERSLPELIAALMALRSIREARDGAASR